MSAPRSSRPRVLSGIRPTGDSFQLGNYVGAVRHWAAMQDESECYFFLADLHALTESPEPAQLRARTRNAVAQLLALGVDPVRSTVFAQSHVPEHAELGWVLGCLTGFGEASRMTQFKEKGGGSVGLFTYPVLQAADILMYQADAVPIGEDQRQHLELTRDLAQRFNTRYGDTFTLPGAYAGKPGERIKDLQDPARKMSKSIGGHRHGVGARRPQGHHQEGQERGHRHRTRGARRRRQARHHQPADDPVRLHRPPVPELEAAYEGKGYGDFKADVAEAVVELFAPVRERYAALVADPAELDRVLADGAARAGAVARETMAAVRERVGLLAPA